MKHLFLLCLGIFFTGACAMAQENYESPVDYMSAISKKRENISKKFLTYASAVAHGGRAKKIENLRSKLLDEVQEARMNIASMPSYKGDKAFRDTAVNFMKLYYNVLNEDYSKIVNMEEIAEQSYDDMEAYMMAQEMADKKLDEGNDKMKAVVQEFAAKNNVILTSSRDELSDMIDKVNQVNVYYHEVYLIFFKAYKQEAYMLEAIEKNNITGIEQNKSSLLKYAQEGQQKLAPVKAFEGDNTLVSACKEMLDFYVMEAGDKMSTVSDYLLTKERYETIKKEFEKKSDHSKDDVNAYNKSVNDFNDAVKAYNKNMAALYKQREEKLDKWNKGSDDFFDQHTPHYN